MKWYCEPPQWQEGDGVLQLTTAPKTDFWRKTHDGGIRHNGHFYYREIAGDFSATVVVEGDYRTLYDQAGLMVDVDEANWLKCGIEYVGDVQYASAVVTRDFSDWSIVPLVPAPPSLGIRVERHGDTFQVYYALPGAAWVMLRQCTVPAGETVRVGYMACSPGELGFSATLRGFTVDQNSA